MDYSRRSSTDRPNSKEKKRRKRKNGFVFILLRIIIILIIIGCFAGAGAALGAYMGVIESAPTLNTDDVVPENYTSFIYDDQGNEIDSLHGKENRQYVQLSDIPINLQNAVVAIEDERFYDHNGIDLKGILRALYVNVKEGDLSQGASTITQQLIKNEALTSEKKFTRKIQEQYLAVVFESNLEKKFGTKKKAKDYILELYLNTISLNHGLNGVGAAAKFYFGKEVSELTLSESACLAGITKNPSAYSPISFPDENRKRTLTVLEKMKELEYITESEYNEAKNDDFYSRLVGTINTGEGGSTHSYFVDALIDSVAEDLKKQKDMNEQQAYNLIYSGGLSIKSTVNVNMQSIMEESYKKDELFPPRSSKQTAIYTISYMDNATEKQTHVSRKAEVSSQEEAEAFAQSVRDELLDENHSLVLDNLVMEDLQSAMVLMDYKDGAVKALIGGRGEKLGDRVFNRATQAKRQPGSCFKVLAAYAPAIDLGILSAGSIIVDEPTTIGGYSPKNWWGDSYRGPSTVREGIKDSMNVVTVKIMDLVTPQRAWDYLMNFGFTTLVEGETRNDGKYYTDIQLASCLGGLTDGVTVLELTAAYGAIANGGLYNKPILYTEVLDHNGNVLLKNEQDPVRVLKESTAYILTDCMKDVVSGGGTGGRARFTNVKMPVAGKTGTTTKDVDLTFAGYTPYYVAGIWLGYDTPKTIKYNGISYHLMLWKDVMEQIHQNLEYKDFVQPSTVTRRTVCSASGGQPISGLCDNDYYGAGTVTDLAATDYKGANEPCTVHKEFTVCKESGNISSDRCPPDEVASVILAVDENNNIINMPSDTSGKMYIDVTQTCSIDHKREPEKADENEYIMGGDEDGDITLPPDINIPETNIPEINTPSNESNTEPMHPTIDPSQQEPIGSSSPVVDNPEDIIIGAD